MQCARCGTELVENKPFCHACGAPAPVRCAGCGTTVDPGFRFCPDCGTEIHPAAPDAAAPAPGPNDPFHRFSQEIPRSLARKIEASRGSISGERKIVTVFFCDLVGSTAIADGLDPEEYRDLLDRYLEIAFREVYRFDGIVNQLAGDGFMALFGAPVAHEDAPARAVHAALGIRDALRRLSERERKKRAVELELRIGIHTGPVVVGTVGNDLKMDYTAIGDTTNLGARLQSLADPGVILISDATWRSVRGLFQLRSAGDLPVKGKMTPIRAYEVLGARETVTPISAAEARGLTPLVGRTEELAQLRACFERARGRLGQVAAVVGEAGTGRSRLVYEFRQQLQGEDVVVLEGRSSSLAQKIPYAPFAAMWRTFFELKAKDTPEEARRKIADRLTRYTNEPDEVLPYIGRLLSIPMGEETDLPREELLHATFEALARLVAGISETSPVVLVMEDLHWADDSSRDLLRLALPRLARARLMLLVSHRPDFPFVPSGNAVYTRIHLRRLAREDVTAVIRAVAGAPLPTELEALIDIKSEGVPFFVEEITRSLLEDGSLRRRENGELGLERSVSELRLPGTVEEVIGARLDRLGAPAKRVVQIASVLGRQVRRDHLQALLAGEPIDLDGELGRLESLGILHRKALSSADEYRFGESLTQEVAYQSLLLRERRSLHERVGTLLENDSDEPTVEQSALRAHHLALSENREKALHALLEAGDDAAAFPSYRAAYDCYREAWELGETILREAEARSPELLRAIVRATSGLSRLSVFYKTSDPDESERAATRAHELAEELDDVESSSLALSARGMIVFSAYANRFSEGIGYVEQALDSARSAGLPVATVSISRGLAWAYLLDGRFREAADLMEWILAELERSEHREERSDLYLGSRWMRDAVRIYSDHPEDVVESAKQTHELAVSVSNRTVRSGTASLLATRHFLQARYDEAERWAAEALEVGEAIGGAASVLSGASILILSRRARGESFRRRWVDSIEAAVSPGVAAHINVRFVVDSLLAAGETERAMEVASSARTGASGRLRAMTAASALADVLAVSGGEGANRAAAEYAFAIDTAREIGARSSLAGSLIGLARLELGKSRPSRAVPLLEEALEVSRALGLGHYESIAERMLRDQSPAVSVSA